MGEIVLEAARASKEQGFPWLRETGGILQCSG